MDDIECLGNEHFVEDCDFRGWRVHNCGHREDAAVICEGIYYEVIRLLRKFV